MTITIETLFAFVDTGDVLSASGAAQDSVPSRRVC